MSKEMFIACETEYISNNRLCLTLKNSVHSHHVWTVDDYEDPNWGYWKHSVHICCKSL